MIVLDTNVLSERVQQRPDPAVLAWLAANASEAAITAVTVNELIYGVGRLPAGRRRESLTLAVEQMVSAAGARLLAYDEHAARVHAQMRIAREAHGKPLPTEDGMIAAICRVHQAPLATRNSKDFAGLGLQLINPWA